MVVQVMVPVRHSSPPGLRRDLPASTLCRAVPCLRLLADMTQPLLHAVQVEMMACVMAPTPGGVIYTPSDK
jgi:hypothetical protein